ncbi:MAG: hypothetical protein B6247_04035 [Candidatus Parabeggiatoa sp. nov. 2]|nr:MAG: hypothetical protein B6247_04035 [Beggiatoa sp. 4572_84]
MRKLADLVLPEGARWTDQLMWTPVRQVAQRTTLGTVVYTTQKLHGGRPVTLEFPEQTAWLSFGQVQKILEWASLPGQSFVFSWDDFQYAVLFDHERLPTTEFISVADLNHSENDQFFGKIHLVTLI